VKDFSNETSSTQFCAASHHGRWSGRRDLLLRDLGDEFGFAPLYWMDWLRAAQYKLISRKVRRTSRWGATRAVVDPYLCVDGAIAVAAPQPE